MRTVDGGLIWSTQQLAAGPAGTPALPMRQCTVVVAVLAAVVVVIAAAVVVAVVDVVVLSELRLLLVLFAMLL